MRNSTLHHIGSNHAADETKIKMGYRYEIPSDTGYRNYVVDDDVQDLDPDGFVSDESTGDEICERVLEAANLVFAPQWDAHGPDGAMRLLYWETEEDAEDDAGANAMGQIVKTPVADDDES